jgi:RNA polymerase sigma factor (sigma-70 family)
MEPAARWAWIAQNEGLLLRAAYAGLGRRLDEDQKQDLRITIYNALGRFNPARGASPTTFVWYRAKGFGSERRRGGHEMLELEDWQHPATDGNAEARVELGELVGQLERLPEKDRVAMQMRMSGNSMDTIGASIGCGKTWVSRRLARATRRVCEALGREVPATQHFREQAMDAEAVEPPDGVVEPERIGRYAYAGPPCSVCGQPIRKDNTRGAHSVCLMRSGTVQTAPVTVQTAPVTVQTAPVTVQTAPVQAAPARTAPAKATSDARRRFVAVLTALGKDPEMVLEQLMRECLARLDAAVGAP